MIHCPLSAWKEYRNGVAKGLDLASHTPRDFAREVHPIRFWLTIIVTFLAGLMGLCFLLVGIAFFIYD